MNSAQAALVLFLNVYKQLNSCRKKTDPFTLTKLKIHEIQIYLEIN